MPPNGQDGTPVEAFTTFAGGQDSSAASPLDLAPDQVQHLVNATVRSGYIDPRPGFHAVDLSDAPAGFARGKGQGIAHFGSAGQFVVAFDGKLFRIHADEGSAAPVAGGRQLFSRSADRIDMTEHAGHLVCSDGVNPVVLVSPTGYREADRASGELFAYDVAASGWHRLWFAKGRKIYYTNHEFYEDLVLPGDEDSGYDLSNSPFAVDAGALTFTQTTYLEVPSSAGDVVAMAFMPLPKTDTGQGPLVVFCERQTLFFDVAVPPADWAGRDIMQMALPGIGASSPSGVVPRPADIMFLDHEGRVRSLRAASQDETTPQLQLIDRPVAHYSEGESPAMRKHRIGFWYDNRCLFSVRPFERWDDDRRRAASSGLVVVEEDLAPRRRGNGPPVWAGLWTGIRPVYAATGGGTCLVLSRDSDGVNRVYTLTRDSPFDYAPEGGGLPASRARKCPEVAVVTRPLEFGFPLLSKSLTGASARVTNIRGPFELEACWQSDGSPPAHWFTHCDSTNTALFGPGGQLGARGQDRPRINFPEVPVGHRDGHKPFHQFYRATPTLFMRGDARLEGVYFQCSAPRAEPLTRTTERHGHSSSIRVGGGRVNLFRYDAAKAQN